MHTSDFDYALPEGLIAAYPAARRDSSRLLVLDRATGAITHRVFSDLPEYVRAGDILAINNTRVFPARLTGRLPTGGACEFLLVRALDHKRWLALVKPGRKVRPGKVVEIGDGALTIRVEDYAETEGERVVELEAAGGADPLEVIERLGHVPLPPYLGREDETSDRERYQTVYARHTGAVAAPTAGLHFTPEVMGAVKDKGAEFVELTLHVGPGTFRPVTVEEIDEHKMEEEYFEVSSGALAALRKARLEGRRVIAVGTTSVRTLESVATRTRALEEDASGALSGWTDIFIRPGYTFRAVDSLITNFHLPRSTLMMLVAAFAGRELTMRAYSEAVRERYRFYSYGDAMLIL